MDVYVPGQADDEAGNDEGTMCMDVSRRTRMACCFLTSLLLPIQVCGTCCSHKCGPRIMQGGMRMDAAKRAALMQRLAAGAGVQVSAQ